ncbi:MAG: DUF814 domain-containing protein [bacterium]|nr:MAG: DUF814 domain-containing protein [bacterium]
MELHYYTLKRLSEELSAICRNSRVEACYTQKKNELTLQIRDDKNYTSFLILSADPHYPFLLSRSFQKRARLSKDVLQGLLGIKISHLSILPGDRIINVYFSSKQIYLVIQLFLKRTNFFVVDENRIILEAFKQNKKFAGQTYSIPAQNHLEFLKLDRKKFSALLHDNPTKTLFQQLKRNFYELNNTLLKEIEFQSKIDLSRLPSEVNHNELNFLCDTIHKLLERCWSESPRIYLKDDNPVYFTLTSMNHLDNLETISFLSINEALTRFIFQKQKVDQNEQLVNQLKTLIDNKLEQLELVIKRLQDQPDEEEQRKYFQKLGELLLAQLHDIPSGVSQVVIRDLYDPNQIPITVILNPELSVQENAQDYFQRARMVAENKRQIKQNFQRIQKQKNEIIKIKNIFGKQLDLKTLKKIERKLQEMHILQTDSEKLQEVYRPYKEYYYESWEIWVGKNARDNDEMTFRKAHKEDTWLHAQGVSGSHIIIRHKKPGQNPPKSVLYYAARLAAGQSKAKHSTTVPVIYTKVKYVRKPRGSVPGVVSAERVSSVFAEPLL